LQRQTRRDHRRLHPHRSRNPRRQKILQRRIHHRRAKPGRRGDGHMAAKKKTVKKAKKVAKKVAKKKTAAAKI
jgi:hypothetical protein